MPPEGGRNYVLKKRTNGHGENTMWVFPKNRGGPPKSSILIGFSIINHPFWGTPIFGNIHVWLRFIDLKENRMLFSCHIVGCLLHLRVPSGWTHISKPFPKSAGTWCAAQKSCWQGVLPKDTRVVKWMRWREKRLMRDCCWMRIEITRLTLFFFAGGLLEVLFTSIGNQQIKAAIFVSPRNTKTNLAGDRKEAKVPVVSFIVLRAKDLPPGFLTAS